MDETVDVHPLITCVHNHTATRSFPHPDATEQGLEADAMLIESPPFDAGLRMGLLDLVSQERTLLVKASCSSGSAFA
jgi:hypothetical protein